MELNRDFSEFIACFAARDVRFLIVGGYAVAAHGHPRYTKDLDVWVRVDAENAARIVAALDDFGFGQVGLGVEDFLAEEVGRAELHRNKLATGRLRDLADVEDLGLGLSSDDESRPDEAQ